MDPSLVEINRSIDVLEARLRDIQRARQAEQFYVSTSNSPVPHSPAPPLSPASATAAAPDTNVMRAKQAIRIIEPDLDHLESHCIVAHNGGDRRSRPYDMLRTQLLQAALPNSWRLVGIASPMHGCGKTLTAINLALSLSRQRDVDPVLVDLDLRRPRVAEQLGLELPNSGTLDVLKGNATIDSSIVQVRHDRKSLFVLGTAQADDASDLVGSSAMKKLLRDLKSYPPQSLVLVNLPPMLASDDVLKIVKELDCVVLVTAVGSTKAADVEECLMYLRDSQLVRVVVNNATDKTSYYA